LHHCTTIFLCVFSYMQNYVRIGHLVYFVHDVGDIFIYGAKIFVDTPYIVPTVCFYIGMLVSCGYLRLYVFPLHLINSSYFESPMSGITAMSKCVFCSGLCFLQVQEKHT
jgi:hypothetical protein